MKKTKIVSAALSALIFATGITAAGASSVTAEEKKQYTVTFLDFEGNVFETQIIDEGGQIDYSTIDVSPLHRHIDVYTEQEFAAWSETPSTTNKDISIQALSKTAVISIEHFPTKTRYYSSSGNISLKGLEVLITLYTQTPELDENGDYIVEENTVDISPSCITEPADLSEAFANSDKAQVTIYPIGDQKAIYTYDIVCFDGLGDVNNNGYIDASDASAVLSAYASLAAIKNYTITDEFQRTADVNMDGIIDAKDASFILSYYARISANPEIDWDDIIPGFSEDHDTE